MNPFDRNYEAVSENMYVLEEQSSSTNLMNFWRNINQNFYLIPYGNSDGNSYGNSYGSSCWNSYQNSYRNFPLAVESCDLSQADKSIIRVSSFPNLSDG